MKTPLEPSWCASLGTAKDCFGLGSGKIAERVTHFRFLWRILWRIFMSQFLSTVFSAATVVVVMVWASPASIFGFGGAQEGPFSAALENGFSRM